MVRTSTCVFGEHDITHHKAQSGKNVPVRAEQPEQRPWGCPKWITLRAAHCSLAAYRRSSPFLAPGSRLNSQRGADPCIAGLLRPPLLADPARSGALRRAQPACPSSLPRLVPTPTQILHARWTRTIKAVSQAGGD